MDYSKDDYELKSAQSVRQPPVQAAFEVLLKNAHSVRSKANELSEKLRPVSIPVPETGGKEQPEASGARDVACDVEEMLREVSNVLRDAERTLNTTLSALQI